MKFLINVNYYFQQKRVEVTIVISFQKIVQYKQLAPYRRQGTLAHGEPWGRPLFLQF